MCFGTFVLLGSGSASAAGVEDLFRSDNLRPREKVIAEELIGEIGRLLPDTVREGLSASLSIRFEYLNDGAIPKVPRCEVLSAKEAEQGKTKYGTFIHATQSILLERNLLPQYAYGARALYNCQHENMRSMAVAVVLHEIFHAYDMANSRRGQISEDPIFKGQLFWSGDKKSFRVTDPYENSRVEEYAAVNFEYFLLDREYRCRRPAQYRYFSRKLKHSPFPHYECPNENRGRFLVFSPAEGIPMRLLEVDFDRIYQAQYLLASKGEGIVAGFGHSMVRLVICAPERQNPFTGKTIPATPVGPECLKDIDYHLVISFRANLNDIFPSMLKGVFGKYPSILYVFSMRSIIDEYNKQGMRDLYAFPLQYSDQQKKAFLYNTLNLHWEYRGVTGFLAIIVPARP